jgi:hypothetical protein
MNVGKSPWQDRQARVRREPSSIGFRDEWVIFDPVDGATIAVRYTQAEADALADGYNLGARAARGSE